MTSLLRSLPAAFVALTIGMTGLTAGATAEQQKTGQQQSETAPASEFLTGTLEMDMLLGKWCGNLGEYFFNTDRLDILRFSDQKRYSWPIVKANFGPGWIELHFDNSGKKNTGFYEFSKDDQVMHQMPNVGGDNGPKMRFHRCK